MAVDPDQARGLSAAGARGGVRARGPHDFQCDWGRVLVSEPPERFVISILDRYAAAAATRGERED
jgi:hypothetical protein